MKKRQKNKATEKLLKMKDSDIDFSDIPEQNPDDWMENVIVRQAKVKKPITIRLDDDVLKFFKEKGEGYQTRINDVLRAFVDKHLHI